MTIKVQTLIGWGICAAAVTYHVAAGLPFLPYLLGIVALTGLNIARDK